MDNTKNKRLKSYKEVNFFYSIWYTIFLAILIYLCWFFDVSVYGIFALSIVLFLVFLFCRDISPTLPIVFLFAQIIFDTEKSLSGYKFYIAAACIVFVGIILHIIRFRPFKNYGKVKGFCVACAFCALAIMLGGITIAKERAPIPACIVCIFAVLFALFMFLFAKSLGRDNAHRFIRTLGTAIIASSFLAVVQLITVLFRSGDFISALKNPVNVGFANSGYLANIIARSIPVSIYLATRDKKNSHLWLVFAFVCGLGILLSRSRSGLLISLLMTIVSLIYFVPQLKKKFYFIGTLCALIGLTAVGIGFFFDEFQKLAESLLNFSLDFEKSFATPWKIGWQRFVSNPIFGVGIEYGVLDETHFRLFRYENTIVQILACFGIFGFVAFVFYFYHQYRILIKAKLPLMRALAFTLLFVQLYSLFNSFFFTPQDFLQMAIITLAGIKVLPEKDTNSLLYTLSDKIKNKKGGSKKI